MPRYDCTTPHKNRRHHRNMKSGHKGNGGDAKIKAAKRLLGNGHPAKPSKKKRQDEPA